MVFHQLELCFASLPTFCEDSWAVFGCPTDGPGDHYVDPCPVKLVGRMELHGKTGISWTRLVETAEAGSSLLKVEEARVPILWGGRCLRFVQSGIWKVRKARILAFWSVMILPGS